MFKTWGIMDIRVLNLLLSNTPCCEHFAECGKENLMSRHFYVTDRRVRNDENFAVNMIELDII